LFEVAIFNINILNTLMTKIDDGTPAPETEEIKQGSTSTSSEEFEKYKIKIGLFKWAIGTVGLTLITYFINWGFKDREQGIAELQVYDKYASETVIFAVNPNNRLLLAQFFANVTPSDKLKCGWKDYLKVVTVEADTFNVRLKRWQKIADSLSKDTSTTEAKAAYRKAKEREDGYEKINSIKLADEKAPAVVEFKTTVGKPNESLAREFELKGFEALLAKDLDRAINNFTLSENSYNGYHSSYNIARHLQSIKSGFDNSNQSWVALNRHIAQHFSWKMPPEIKKRLNQPISQ
jgi:hypothetical protein